MLYRFSLHWWFQNRNDVATVAAKDTTKKKETRTITLGTFVHGIGFSN
jgi:hypothetical protein